MCSSYKLKGQGDNIQPWCTPFLIGSSLSCSMFSSNCCYLTCIQISRRRVRSVWYSHLLKNFPQFVVIHTVKGFGVVIKAEVDGFLELSCFLDDPADVGNLFSGSSAFSESSVSICKFTVHVLLKSGLENFEHYFASVWDECSCAIFWSFLGIAFLWENFGRTLSVFVVQRASRMAQQVKNSLALQETQETQVWSLDRGDPLEKEMAIHSSILAWKTPWTKKPDSLQLMVSKGLGTTKHAGSLEGSQEPEYSQLYLLPVFPPTVFSTDFRLL